MKHTDETAGRGASRSRREGDGRKRDSEDLGGSITVDGKSVEIDMAEWGWDRPVTGLSGGSSRGAGGGSDSELGEAETTVRLQKALAHAGVASRRACETLITSGRVTVNGKVQRELGSRIDTETDEVRVDGVVVQLDASKRYFVLNKPRGIVSTMSDEHGRPDLREFTDQVEDRLYNVGRLDTDTSGLLILTNDGELAHKLAHPSFGVQKTYIAKVRGRVTASVIQRLYDGVELVDGPIRVDSAKLLPGGVGKSHSLVEVTLHSGKNRIVRRLLAEVGHPVDELVRRQFGPLHLGTLRVGEMRELSAGERGALLSAAEAGAADSGNPRVSGVKRTRENGDAQRDGTQTSRSKQTRGKPGRGGKGTDPNKAGASKKSGAAKKSGASKTQRGQITAGRPGDGKGARGMYGAASRGNPHGRQ